MNTFNKRKNYYEMVLVGKHKAIAQIDIEDFQRVSQYNWTQGKLGYVRTCIEGVDTYLHRFIMQPASNELVDHKNKNTLDNRKSNMRVATKSQNAMNSKTQSNNTSGCRGVYYARDMWSYWVAYINVNGKKIQLIKTKDKNKAIKARKLAEEKYFGEYKNNL